MKVADFDFFLPKGLIAKRPLNERAHSRLLVLHRNGKVEHKMFSDLLSYLDPGDMLLMNNTKVFPARLTGYKQTGGKLDILLVREKEDNMWEVLSRGRYTGSLKISEELQADLYDGKTARFTYSGNLRDIIWKYGNMPLPPYIKRTPDESDKERYQTIYAKEEGSIAAPTAGLHFTERLLREISLKGIVMRELTLQVGIGTFRPVRSKKVTEHSMDPEYFEIDNSIISEINKIKESGKKIFSVGTTSTRAIEGYFSGNCDVTSENGKLNGTTDIFIYPDYRFKVVDSLITNFHLPRSTPLLLTSAFCGWENLMKAYAEAISRRYRFFSYGDAMLIV
ncbi:MAG: tRNA preQ1(34) S-adenosylmethionine ribosyltransferase-isomerase QueA [Nitrospirota bacterium]|nr:tRNA preQ1(34) S-adenosylmethionine ribosyltransferase-isomerase QueA [Nitrospirota bacterium]